MLIRNLFLNLSLNKKLVIMMLLLSFILISILLVLYSKSEQELFVEIENQTADLSKAIKVGLEEITSSGSDGIKLQQYLKKINTNEVKEISIISNTDEIIASTNPSEVGEEVTPGSKKRIIKAELGEPLSKEGKVYNVILPVVTDNKHYGYIHLTINAEGISKKLKHNAMKRIAATSLVFGGGIALAIMLSLMYTKPIHNVVNAARSVAAGDLTVTLSTDRKDEIGELTKSFNFMVQKLKDRRSLEKKLREAERFSTTAQMAKNIAHEIRNPLNFISLSVDHFKKKYAPYMTSEKESFESLITSMKQEIQRLNKLVGDFLEYGKPLRLNFQKVDITRLIDEVIAIVSAKTEKDGIKICHEGNDAAEITVDPELIKTCIFNIFLNAFQAMPAGGTLTITKTVSDKMVSIIFEDTGVGISKENLNKVFDPLYSTKSNGLGIGLAMTKMVIEEHGGNIYFQSEEEIGSTVIITVPSNITNRKG